MSKKIVSIIASFLIASLVAVSYGISASGAGNPCTKIHTTKTIGKFKYECVKSGKKLVWNKGIALLNKPAEESAVPIPIAIPVPRGSITFENIMDNVDNVAQVAFENVQAALVSNPFPKAINTTIWVGPNTIPVGSMSEKERIQTAMKLWSGFNQPKTIGLFFFNTQDEPSAEIAYDSWRRTNSISGGQPASMLRNDCLSNNGPNAPVASLEPLKDCSGANAGVVDAIGTGIGIFGVPTEPRTRADTYRLGAIEIHEFTHMVQMAQFLDGVRQPGSAMYSISPCWIQEGQAHFAGKTAASNTLNEYLQQRNGEAKYRTNGNGDQPRRDFEGIMDYLSLTTLPSCEKTYSWGYATGMLAVEALSAIGGVQSTMALYAMEARGSTFSDAFELIYGIPWSDARPILAHVIAQDYLVPSINVN